MQQLAQLSLSTHIVCDTSISIMLSMHAKPSDPNSQATLHTEHVTPLANNNYDQHTDKTLAVLQQ